MKTNKAAEDRPLRAIVSTDMHHLSVPGWCCTHFNLYQYASINRKCGQLFIWNTLRHQDTCAHLKYDTLLDWSILRQNYTCTHLECGKLLDWRILRQTYNCTHLECGKLCNKTQFCVISTLAPTWNVVHF